MREFAFELTLCAHVEAGFEGIVGRQLGASVRGSRIVDVACVEPGPAFDARRALTPATIPDRAIESRVGAGTARYWKDAFDCPPERARAVTERAVEVGFFERERRGGREYVRQTARYPGEWFGPITGIENKPDLGRPGELETQLRTDASLGLFDRVVLATTSHVTGAHLNRIPEAVGIWRFDPGSGERAVLREPTPLAPTEPGVELLDRAPGRTDVRVASAAEKARARRRLAERAYGKGWRTYDMPACAEAEPAEMDGARGLPCCRWKGRLVDAASECGPECAGHDPAMAPEIDTNAERERRTPWRRDPDGRQRRQAGLEHFS
jgi:hypothetical protein